MNARALIVNADDYGLTEGTCRAILEAHRSGIVTSTSVLAVGRAFERCGPWLREHPRLGVGVHLALVGGETPLSPASEIPSLVERDGRFCASWARLLLRSLVRPLKREHLLRELAAQIQRVASLGLPLTHLDSHQHLHLLPAVREVVLELALRFGIPAIRVPRSRGGRLPGVAVNLLAARLRARARARGLAFTEDSFGFDEAGGLDHDRLHRTLTRMGRSGARTLELIAHPGLDRDPERARYPWGFHWGDELRALTAEDSRRLVQRCGFALVGHVPRPT
jgi:predicted glycoside hydrolase/deacetylase ChbG (UPF0249 family)